MRSISKNAVKEQMQEFGVDILREESFYADLPEKA